MKRLILLLLSVSVVVLGGNGAKADTFFNWNSGSGFSGNYTESCDPAGLNCTNGLVSTWSGQQSFDTTLGTQASVPPGLVPSLTFVGIDQSGGSTTLNFGTFGGACGSQASCNTMVGAASYILPYSSAPAGTSFELIMCDNACSSPSVEYWVFYVAATYNGSEDTALPLKNLLSASVIGGVELGGECGGGPFVNVPSSNATCGYIGSAPSGTPLPAAFPLLGTGLVGLWALSRRRRAQAERIV